MAVDKIRLTNRRDELDTTNADVAREVGLSPGYIENIMAGVDQPSRKVIYRLARTLGLEPHEIDPDVYAGKRTPRGDPSEPPQQPPGGPKGPARRQDKEGDKKGPKSAEVVPT